MSSVHRLAVFGLLLLAVQSSFLARADADGLAQPRFALVADHSDDPVLGIVGSGAVEFVETPAPPLPRECKPRYMAGPAVGLVVGPGAIVGGMFMIAAGSFQLDLFGVEDERTTRDRGLIAGGSLFLAAGLATFIYSSAKLSKNRHERRRICDSEELQSD